MVENEQVIQFRVILKIAFRLGEGANASSTRSMGSEEILDLEFDGGDPDLPLSGARGSYRTGAIRVPRGTVPWQFRPVCRYRLGPYRRGCEPAGTGPVSVLDQRSTCGRARGLA